MVELAPEVEGYFTAFDHAFKGLTEVAKTESEKEPSAAVLYEELLRRDEDAKSCLTMLAAIAYLTGQEALAEGYLERTLDLYREHQSAYPSDSGARLQYGLLQLARADTDEGEAALSQVDLPKGQPSGLRDAVALLAKLPEVAVVEFSDSDVVRHSLVTRIVRAYEARENGRNGKRQGAAGEAEPS